MATLLRIAALIDAVNRRCATVVAWLTVAMVAIGSYNAVARYVERDLGLHLSSNAFLELQWYLFSLVFLLGAPYTLRRDGHVRVDVLYGGHNQRAQAWIDLVGTVVFLLPFCAFAIWASWDFVADSWVDREGSPDPGGLPRWILKPVVPAAFLLIAFQGVSEAIKRTGILTGHSATEVGLVEPPDATERDSAEETA